MRNALVDIWSGADIDWNILRVMIAPAVPRRSFAVSDSSFERCTGRIAAMPVLKMSGGGVGFL